MVELKFLNSLKGDATIYIEETDPEKRAELAETVTKLMHDGHVVFLLQGDESRLIKGYDAESNEWLVVATAKESPKGAKSEKYTRLSAQGTMAAAVGRTAGG